MSKRNEGSHQSFSLRRIILQRARLSENHRNNRLSNVESGVFKQDALDNKTKKDFPLRNNGLEQVKVDSLQPTVHNSCQQLNENDSLCIICYIKEGDSNKFFTLELCNHKFCISCLVKYLKNEINESRTDIACPQCSIAIHPNNIEFLLADTPDFKTKYEDFMMRRYLVADPDSRWCPAPDCSYAVIAAGCASCPQLKCERPKCGVSFCYHCKAEWHPDQTCDAARSTRQKLLRTSSVSYSQDSTRRDDIKPCPRCQIWIVKMNDGSCNHMVCSVCGAEFCWLCMKEVSDLHYLSPSGCTFWGKKPWSRKKKIVWQIGTLIGAPVCIALLAGIAVPSMVIGIPVWVGRKLLDRYKNNARQRRDILVTIGVTASILVSPFLAGLAIAVGVPILLFYVYGVVPVSLCRAGCGKSSKSDEYKFDVNLSDETRAQYNADGASIDAVSRIGETSIGDVSLSASGSVIEVVNNNAFRNIHSYRESTIALAGSMKNQKVECSDNLSTESTSAITCHSEKSSNMNDASLINVLAESFPSYKQP